MERETGIEPATSSLGSWRSTAELLPPCLLIMIGSRAVVKSISSLRSVLLDGYNAYATFPSMVTLAALPVC
jgi:hypothetical protein